MTSEFSTLLKCRSHPSNNLAFVKFISKSSPKPLAVATISAFFILFKADFVGVSESFKDDLYKLSFSLGVDEPPNKREKNPFFLLSLVSLIIFA